MIPEAFVAAASRVHETEMELLFILVQIAVAILSARLPGTATEALRFFGRHSRLPP